jgi:hypothetical protein
MRTFLLALCLLAAPVLLFPTASAHHEWYCWESLGGSTCCHFPEPIGNEGSLPYVLTESAGHAWIATCGTADRGIVGAQDFVDCVVFNRC